MLGLLSGRRHHVLSGVCVVGADGRPRVRVADTVVAFKRLTDAEIDWYVESGEGMGKAGGYAIQGRAEVFVRFLSGSHSNVVGLPIFENRALLSAAGVSLGGVAYRSRDRRKARGAGRGGAHRRRSEERRVGTGCVRTGRSR